MDMHPTSKIFDLSETAGLVTWLIRDWLSRNKTDATAWDDSLWTDAMSYQYLFKLFSDLYSAEVEFRDMEVESDRMLAEWMTTILGNPQELTLDEYYDIVTTKTLVDEDGHFLLDEIIYPVIGEMLHKTINNNRWDLYHLKLKGMYLIAEYLGDYRIVYFEEKMRAGEWRP